MLFQPTGLQAFQESVPADSSKEEFVAAPLELAAIPRFAQETRKLLMDVRDLRRSVDQGDIMARLGQAELQLEEEFRLLNDSMQFYRLENVNKQDVELRQIRDRLDQWMADIEKWNAQGVAMDIKIEQRNLVLALTNDSLTTILAQLPQLAADDSIEVPTASFERLSEVINGAKEKLRKEQEKLSAWLTGLQSLESELVIAYDLLDRCFRYLELRRSSIASNLFTPDRPVIWKENRRKNTESLATLLRNELKGDMDIVRSFFQNRPYADYAMLIIFVLVLGLLVYMRIGLHRWFREPREEILEARVVIKSPLISAMIITWFFVFISFDLPREVNQFIGLVVLPPLAYLLYRIRPFWTWRTAVLFVLTNLVYVFLPLLNFRPFLQRISLVLLSIAGVTLFLWLRGRVDSLRKDKSQWFGLLPSLLWPFAIMCVGAFTANIIGSVHLAQLLITVTLIALIAMIVIRLMTDLVLYFFYLILLGPLMNNSRIMQQHSDIVIRKLRSILRVGAFVLWIYVILNALAVRERVIHGLIDIVNYPLEIGEMRISLANILAFYAVLQVSIWISQFIRFFLDKEVFSRVATKKGTAGTTSLLVKYTITVLGFFLALSAAGVQLDKLSILLGALGVGIGFGLQNIVNNFISGIILATERPIHIGDMVDITGVSGYVQDIGLRATIIRTWDGADVVVPNGDLLAGKLTNWMLTSMHRRVTVDVRLPFDCDLNAVSGILLDAAAALPDVLKDPAPNLNFPGIVDGVMEIKLNCWIARADQYVSLSRQIRIAVYQALREAGYTMSPPRQQVYVSHPEPIDPGKPGPNAGGTDQSHGGTVPDMP